jgi:hypothetical protein
VLATNGRIHAEFIRVLEDVARKEKSPWP